MYLENLQINNKDLSQSLMTQLNLSLSPTDFGQNLNELKSSGLSSASDSSFDLPVLKDNLLTVVSTSLSNNIHLTTPN
jgi:hypothetical protein